MLEALENAKGEIKRSDHLIYVSLKYTRTVDVLKSIIKRLINAFDYGIDCLLKFAQDQKKIQDIPKLPIAKVEAVRSAFNDPQINELLDFYIFLRKLDKADYESSQEYRRHVTMTAFVDDKKIEVTIDSITEYFERIKLFVALVEKIVIGEEES